MMSLMRTTIDIPPGLHQRLISDAQARELSFSARVTEALLKGMADIETAIPASIDPQTGLMAFNFNRGRLVTDEEVAGLIAEDE